MRKKRRNARGEVVFATPPPAASDAEIAQRRALVGNPSFRGGVTSRRGASARPETPLDDRS